MLAASLDAFVAVDSEGCVVEWNHAAESLFGYPRDEALGCDLGELIIPEEERELHARTVAGMLESADHPLLGARLERACVRADGTRFPVEVTVTRAELATPVLVACVRDVTERRREQEAQEAEARQRLALVQRLERAEARYRELIERLPIVSYLAEYGPEGRWHYVSPQIETLLGFPPEQWLADPELWWNRVHPDDRERIAAEEERCAQSLEPLRVEYRMIARDGRIVWIHDEGSLGRPADGGKVLVEGVLHDVSERRRAEEELRRRAYHDDLTGLPNRRHLEEELRRRREDGRGTLAIVDVDDLKYVNDSLGHAAGDALLRRVAASLRAALAPSEFVARFGGDEFIVLLPAPDETAAEERLAEIVRAVRVRRGPTPAHVSVGAAVFEPGGPDGDEDLIVAADMALHEAKERGGDRHLFVREKPAGHRLAWVGRVRSAIDEGRLELHAQPIARASDGETLGSELLVRMRDEDGELLAPAAFLPTAERFGLISEIDGWVAERAAELAGRGRACMVNVSARSVSDPAYLERIAAALARAGADPRLVVFELTETAAARASGDLQRFGQGIERLGCTLAIDDFGTGFGSLTYLKHMPIRFLKVDMEFVRGAVHSAADRAIVSAINTIAASLGMKTIGEGVEDAQTLRVARELGVDYVQGFHIGRPEPLALG